MEPQNDKDYDFIFKLVLVGETCVGKSCILMRFADDVFVDNYMTTIGVDFRFKTMIVKKKIAKIQIWDTAGQERYRSITTAYYRGAAAVIICCDITNNISFNKIDNWIKEVSKQIDDDVEKIVFMNKVDLVNKRQVSKDEIKKFEERTGIKVLEVSAKTGEGIEKAFEFLIERLINKNDKHESSNLILTDKISDLKSSCCSFERS